MISLLQLPKIVDNRGNLSFLENKSQFPFDIKRVYMIYDVPGGEMRGDYGYKKLEEVIIALSGSFDVQEKFLLILFSFFFYSLILVTLF